MSPEKRRFGKGVLGIICAAMITGPALLAGAHLSADKIADFSRSLLGDEVTAEIESLYFSAQDRFDRFKFNAFGGQAVNPFSQEEEKVLLQSASTDDTDSQDSDPVLDSSPTPIISQTEPFIGPQIIIGPQKLTSLILPEIKPLHDKLATGEGVWTTTGLPHLPSGEILMARTYVLPDVPARPDATAGVLIIDGRYITLHMVGGTEDPGGDRGVIGPGTIPDKDRPNLLAALNGGFKGPHGGYGMYADGLFYRPLRDGFASVAVTKDGKISMGEWGRTMFWNNDMMAVRQNAALLVENGEVTEKASKYGQNNEIWGYVYANTADFITTRSAIGLTKNGDLLIVDGNRLSVLSLAQALQSVGADVAMELDMNNPYVSTALFSHNSDGTIVATRFMNTDIMPTDPSHFLKAQQTRDDMYVTLNYH